MAYNHLYIDRKQIMSLIKVKKSRISDLASELKCRIILIKVYEYLHNNNITVMLYDCEM